MRRISIIVIVLMLTAALAAQMPQARQLRHDGHTRGNTPDHQCGMQQMNQMGQHMIPRIMEHLKLTEKQREDIQKLHYNHRLAMIDLNASLKKLALQRQKGITEANFQEAKKVSDQFHNKRAEIAKKNIELRENIFKLLDKEQQDAYRKMANQPRGAGCSNKAEQDCPKQQRERSGK